MLDRLLAGTRSTPRRRDALTAVDRLALLTADGLATGTAFVDRGAQSRRCRASSARAPPQRTFRAQPIHGHDLLAQALPPHRSGLASRSRGQRHRRTRTAPTAATDVSRADQSPSRDRSTGLPRTAGYPVVGRASFPGHSRAARICRLLHRCRPAVACSDRILGHLWRGRHCLRAVHSRRRRIAARIGGHNLRLLTGCRPRHWMPSRCAYL